MAEADTATTEAGTIRLQVAAARQEESGRGVARIPRKAFQALGLAEGGVDYAMDEHNAKLVTAEMKKKVDAAKADIEQRIKDVRESLTSEDAADINAKAEALQTAFHAVSTAMYERAQQAQTSQATDGAANGANGAGAADAEEDVVDAEVVDEGR